MTTIHLSPNKLEHAAEAIKPRNTSPRGVGSLRTRLVLARLPHAGVVRIESLQLYRLEENTRQNTKTIPREGNVPQARVLAQKGEGQNVDFLLPCLTNSQGLGIHVSSPLEYNKSTTGGGCIFQQSLNRCSRSLSLCVSLSLSLSLPIDYHVGCAFRGIPRSPLRRQAPPINLKP